MDPFRTAHGGMDVELAKAKQQDKERLIQSGRQPGLLSEITDMLIAVGVLALIIGLFVWL